MNFEFKSVEEIQEQGSGSYGVFGKNEGAILDQFDYVEGEYGPSINVSFKVLDGTYKKFINPVTKVWAKAGGEIQVGHAEYEANKKASESRVVLFINQIAEAITSAETVREALTTAPPADMVGYFKLMERVVKSNASYKTKPLDLFLQYQYTPRAGTTRTYLEVPKPDNLKNGNLIFVTAAQGPGYTEVRDGRGLSYVKEDGTAHPMKRTSYFMGQAYAKMSNTGDASQTEGAAQFNAPTTPGASATGGNNW